MIPIYAQLDASAEVVRAASAQSWEAALLAVIVLGAFGAFGWMVKLVMTRHLAIEERTLADGRTREERLSTRVTQLETFVHQELLTTIRQASEMNGRILSASTEMSEAARGMTGVVAAYVKEMENKPCLLEVRRQLQLLKMMNGSADDNAVKQAVNNLKRDQEPDGGGARP